MWILGLALVAGMVQGAGDGGVRGVVVDQTGAVIPGASVVFAPEDHSRAARTASTGRDGQFSFGMDGAGPYSVCVSFPGFMKECLAKVAGGNLGDVVLKVGFSGSPIVVDPGASRIDPASANTGRIFVQGTTAADARKLSRAADAQKVSAPGAVKPTSKDDLLRGAYGPYRANNDLLSYHLDVRVNPDKKTIAGKNTVRFRMLADGWRIQLDLVQALAVDKIVAVDEAGRVVDGPLKYTREERAVFIDFPRKLKKGRTYAIDFFYSGAPVEGGRFGGMTFKTDPAGPTWINTACEEEGASVWWPNKDQWRDEVEAMDISVSIPNELVDVSNGRFMGKTDLGDGYTRWDWHVSYPINNYDVSLNIGKYVHFGDTLHGLTLDYWVLPEDLEKAKVQFAQVPGMLRAYEHYFGEYPFARDGYKLVEVPYAGMEHQSAVTYGNHFANGYLDRDWTGVGISLRFDFIIIHESGHEWFGNAVTAKDVSDMWIHEGWTTYLECLYVEYMWGHEDEVLYVNSLKKKVRNDRPVITPRGTNEEPPQDMYFKGALFINTLRSVVDDDTKWFAMIHDFYQEFKYKTIMTEDVVAFFNKRTGMELGPMFNEYLRHADLPVLQLAFGEGTVRYRWKAEEAKFAMPVRVGDERDWQTIRPTAEWQTMKTAVPKDAFQVDTESFYLAVVKD